MLKSKTITYMIFIFTALWIFSIKPDFAVNKTMPKSQKAVIESELHQKAKIELNSSFYQIYRISERLIRANKLYANSWRIAVSTEKNLTKNAYIQDKNLIVISSDLVDAYIGNISALAFVISNEIALKTLKNSSKINQYKEEFKTKMEKADKIEDTDIITAKCYIMLSNKTSPSLSDCMEKKKNEEIELNKSNINKEFADKQKQIEFETDKQALIYIIKAGFDPNISIEVLNFTKNITNNNDMPDISDDRINNIKSVLKDLDFNTLKKQGRANINNSYPLSYERAVNARSIRINSSYGSEENIDKSFNNL